jgi:hypothetical protein
VTAAAISLLAMPTVVLLGTGAALPSRPNRACGRPQRPPVHPDERSGSDVQPPHPAEHRNGHRGDQHRQRRHPDRRLGGDEAGGGEQRG